MSDIICRSISSGREFVIHTDPFSSLDALRSECNSYIQSEARYTELLKERDKQIREDAIDDCIQWIVSKFSYIDELNVPRIRCNASTIEINMREQLMQKGAEND